MKAKVLQELESNSVWYTKASAACLGMRGIKFETWLKKQAHPCTWPNELILYALCIIFCRNALVINGSRIWTTLETNQNMTISVIQEMCETTLLYLGNNLYGTLHRKPFTLERPLKFDLNDMQRMRPIFTDLNTNCMYFEIHKDSDFEQLLRDEEIFDVEEPKPELLPETSTPHILHPDYPPKGVTIKQEPPDATSSIIGKIISQPACVARGIKQELLDSATQSIVEKHSSTCQINQFIQEHGITGLCIEDVRTLITADDHATKFTAEQETSNLANLDDQLNVPVSETALSMVTPTSIAMLPITSPTTVVASIATKTTLSMVTPKTSDINAFTDKTPLPMVTASLASATSTSGTLPMVTSSSTPSALHVVSTATTSKTLPVVTVAQGDGGSSATACTKWSRITNRPLEKADRNNTDTTNKVDMPIIPKLQADIESVESSSQEQETKTGSSEADSRYYEVMNPEGDEVYHLSHQDIVACKCKVPLEKLSKKDITEIKDSLQPARPEAESSSSSTAPKPDSTPPKKPKKLSHHPKKQPSKARLHTQKIIRECNKKIAAKKISATPIKAATTSHIKIKQVAPLIEKEDPVDTHVDSDNTVIYTPPSTPNKNKRKKPVAKFIFQTVGIKIHRDMATAAELKKQCTRKFKCYLCQAIHPTEKALNQHFKAKHGGLDCADCGKGFSSPLSLKKHSYMHKLCSHSCHHCDKTFPFKLQRDFHENVHTTPRFYCTRSGCKSSFMRDSDLKLHQAMHDAEPLHCPDCNYSNPDIRNL